MNARTRPMFWTSNVRTLHLNIRTCESRLVCAKKGRGIKRLNVPHERSNIWLLALKPKTRSAERSNIAFVRLKVQCTWAVYDSFSLFWLYIIMGNCGIVYGTWYGCNNLKYLPGPYIRTVFGHTVSYGRRIQIPVMILMNSSEKGSIHLYWKSFIGSMHHKFREM